MRTAEGKSGSRVKLGFRRKCGRFTSSANELAITVADSLKELLTIGIWHSLHCVGEESIYDSLAASPVIRFARVPFIERCQESLEFRTHSGKAALRIASPLSFGRELCQSGILSRNV